MHRVRALFSFLKNKVLCLAEINWPLCTGTKTLPFVELDSIWDMKVVLTHLAVLVEFATEVNTKQMQFLTNLICWQ